MNKPDKIDAKDVSSALALPDQTVLVLQGGGALGSFQAGVFEELCELGLNIDCVAGISIGAINAALIAGNPPEKRLSALQGFWDKVTSGLLNMVLPEGGPFRQITHAVAAGAVMGFGVPGFFRPHMLPPPLAPDGSEAAISWYDTSALRETLDTMIDWDLLNDGPMRIAVGAVDVQTGNFAYFDTHGPDQTRIDARHIMASGALPPGLPPVEIDGRYYWDGGLVSNTPLAHILETQGRQSMLVFQVDLFPARGPMPQTIDDVWTREKDIRYSSRTRQVTDQYLRLRRDHDSIRRLLDKLPSELDDDPDVVALREAVTEYPVNVVHLIYRQQRWETGAKDFEFSRATMSHHWKEGRESLRRSIRHGDVLARNIASGETAAFDLD